MRLAKPTQISQNRSPTKRSLFLKNVMFFKRKSVKIEIKINNARAREVLEWSATWGDIKKLIVLLYHDEITRTKTQEIRDNDYKLEMEIVYMIWGGDISIS